MGFDDKLKAELARIGKGGAPKYHQKNAETGKLFARERVRLLLDADSFIEDGAFANATDPELPADGVITGLGKIAGRLVAVMANDSTVKAGSWGRRTVEKIVRIQEQALKMRCPMLYLVDYSTGQYLTMSKSVKVILGYEPENFINEGLAFTHENYHKADFRVFNEQIFPDRLSFLKKIPPAEHANYIFSYNFRIRNKEKKYINILQRNCFIKSDDKGNPLLSLGMVINVDHFKNENPVIQVIDKLSSHPDETPETVYKKTFYLHEEDKLFTAREKEVLLWTADGLTSKEIGEKLFLSENTIINHRRNMQAKSNTRNMAELISFSYRQAII